MCHLLLISIAISNRFWRGFCHASSYRPFRRLCFHRIVDVVSNNSGENFPTSNPTDSNGFIPPCVWCFHQVHQERSTGHRQGAPTSSQTAHNPPGGWRMGHDRGGFAPTTPRCPLVVAPASRCTRPVWCEIAGPKPQRARQATGARCFKTSRRSTEFRTGR